MNEDAALKRVRDDEEDDDIWFNLGSYKRQKAVEILPSRPELLGPDTMETIKSLVLVCFDDHTVFAETPQRSREVAPVYLFELFRQLYPTPDALVPLHGVGFRGADVQVPVSQLIKTVVYGRDLPHVFLALAAEAGISIPNAPQIHWAVDMALSMDT